MASEKFGDWPTRTFSIAHWKDTGSGKRSTLGKYKDYFAAAVTTDGVIGLIKNQKITLKNLIVGFVSVGLERLVNSNVFHCPLERHQGYGYCFLFGPVFLLFCANLLIIGEVWQLSGRCFIKRYQRRGEVIARLIPSVLVKAMVGPAAWLIACFVNGDYYLCATVGPGAAERNLTDPADIQTLEKQLAAAKAQSHILAWVVIGIMTALGVIIIITKKCVLKDYLLLRNLYIFERREAAAALLAFREQVAGEDATSLEDVDEPTEKKKKKITLNLGDDDEFDINLDGIPEKTGRENVKKIFQKADSDYSEAYEKFCKLYPRVASGNPSRPWRAVQNKARILGDLAENMEPTSTSCQSHISSV